MADEVLVPIYIANTNPFRLIVRDESDKWDASLDQINSSSYDRIKLHRASKFFDAEIEKPFPLCVGFDGSFIIPATKKYHTLEATLDEFNRIFASIVIGGVYIEGVVPSDLSHGHMTLNGYFRHTKSFGWRGDMHRSLANGDAGNSLAIRLFKPECIFAGRVEAAYAEGARVLKGIPNLSPSLFIWAITHYLRRQAHEAHTAVWICIEQVIEHMWKVLVVEGVKGGSVKNRRQFIESQQWTAAHKAELFFQKNVIGLSTYEYLSVARDARNKFVHRGKVPDEKQVESGIIALIDLIEVSVKDSAIFFNRSNLDKYLEKSSNYQGSAVVKSGDEVMKKAIAWKPLKKIPGESGWVGDFEIFEDITLQRLK